MGFQPCHRTSTSCGGISLSTENSCSSSVLLTASRGALVLRTTGGNAIPRSRRFSRKMISPK